MTWSDLESEVCKLCAKIDNNLDLVVGIARGGIVPAVLLAELLKIKDMYALKVQRDGDERRVAAEVFADVLGKRILLVEDMLETGKSMSVAKTYLESKGAKVKTACLYTMLYTKIKPDYSLRQVNRVVRFPWEKNLGRT